MRSSASLVLVCGLMAAAATPAFAQRTPVIPEGQRVTATLTPGIKASGEMVYASGQLGGRDSTIEGQTKAALESVKKVFEAAGTTMANAVKCTVYLVDVKDFAGMNSEYSKFWPTSPPARTTVVVAALVVQGGKVEITCVAAMPPK